MTETIPTQFTRELFELFKLEGLPDPFHPITKECDHYVSIAEANAALKKTLDLLPAYKDLQFEVDLLLYDQPIPSSSPFHEDFLILAKAEELSSQNAKKYRISIMAKDDETISLQAYIHEFGHILSYVSMGGGANIKKRFHFYGVVSEMFAFLLEYQASLLIPNFDWYYNPYNSEAGRIGNLARKIPTVEDFLKNQQMLLYSEKYKHYFASRLVAYLAYKKMI